MDGKPLAKSVYFPDHRGTKERRLAINFGKKYNDLYKAVANYDSNQLKTLLDADSFVELESRAIQENLPLNTYCIWYLNKRVQPKQKKSTTNKTRESFLEKKTNFLQSIKGKESDGKYKYKRVALSPIRYAGGKSLAVGHIVELIPDGTKKLVSPFFGGGSVEIAVNKHLGIDVIGYDIFDILTNYWKHQLEKPDVLYAELQKLKPTKEEFERIRLILNDVWKKRVTLDPLTLAVYYVYNFNLSYGPGFMGWSSEIYLNKEKYTRMIEKIRDFNAPSLKIKQGDFQSILPKHRDDFLYCDPPYYIGEDSKMFKGIYPMRNIPVHHKGFPHEALRDLLKEHRGGFILSYNDCPTIREYYKELKDNFYFPTWQYTMGQGETRIGKNRIQKGDDHIKASHEILIYCPPKN